MSASSKFSLILMHDDGSTHRMRMNKGTLRLLILLVVLSPLLGILGLWVGWDALRTVADWHDERLTYQTELDTLRVRLERLSALELLLAPEKTGLTAVPTPVLPPPDSGILAASPLLVPGAGPGKPQTGTSPVASSDVPVHSNSETIPASSAEQNGKSVPLSASAVSEDDAPPDKTRGAVNTGRIRVENMQARLVDRRRIRVSVDIYSTDPGGKQLNGRTEFSIITADGQQYPLTNDDAMFRISRFKKIVNVSNLPVSGTEVENAAVMVEVTADNKLLYRNMFSVESR